MNITDKFRLRDVPQAMLREWINWDGSHEKYYFSDPTLCGNFKWWGKNKDEVIGQMLRCEAIKINYKNQIIKIIESRTGTATRSAIIQYLSQGVGYGQENLEEILLDISQLESFGVVTIDVNQNRLTLSENYSYIWENIDLAVNKFLGKREEIKQKLGPLQAKYGISGINESPGLGVSKYFKKFFATDESELEHDRGNEPIERNEEEDESDNAPEEEIEEDTQSMSLPILPNTNPFEELSAEENTEGQYMEDEQLGLLNKLGNIDDADETPGDAGDKVNTNGNAPIQPFKLLEVLVDRVNEVRGLVAEETFVNGFIIKAEHNDFYIEIMCEVTETNIIAKTFFPMKKEPVGRLLKLCGSNNFNSVFGITEKDGRNQIILKRLISLSLSADQILWAITQLINDSKTFNKIFNF